MIDILFNFIQKMIRQTILVLAKNLSFTRKLMSLKNSDFHQKQKVSDFPDFQVEEMIFCQINDQYYFSQVTEANRENEEKKETTQKKMKRDSDSDEEVKEEPASKKAKTETKDTKPMMNKTDSDLSTIDFSCKKLNADGEAYNIKICSWNVSGIRAVIKVSRFFHLNFFQQLYLNINKLM